MSFKRCAVLIWRPVALFMLATDCEICINLHKTKPASSGCRPQDVLASTAMTAPIRGRATWPLCFKAHLHLTDIGAVQVRVCLHCLQAPCSSIEAICKQKLRVDPATVLDPEAPQALSALVLQLQRAQEEATAVGSGPPAMDPVADLKLNQLEVVQAVREHQQLMQVGTGSSSGQYMCWWRACDHVEVRHHRFCPVSCGMESFALITGGKLTA